MISFADQFGELRPGAVWYATSEPHPPEPPPEGLLWDWRQVSDGAFAWRLVPAGDATPRKSPSEIKYLRDWFDKEVRPVRAGRSNPLAAMCNHKDTHSTERLPVPQASTTEEAPAGINTVAGFDHRPGAWK